MMKKRFFRRWICAVLCILLLLTAAPLTGSALDTPTFRVNSASAHPGETVQVTVSVENNPGIITAMLRLSYDPEALTLTAIENGAVFGDDVFHYGGDLTAIPYKFYWMDALRPDNNTANGTLATLTFRVADEAPAGETTVSVDYDAISTMDVQLNPVTFTVENGGVEILPAACTVTLDPNGGECGIPAITVYPGEPYGVLPIPAREGFTFDGWFCGDALVTEDTLCTQTDDHTLTAHWTEISVPATLATKAGSGAIIDEEKGFIYGLDFSLTVDDLTNDYLDVIGNGRLEYSTVAAGTGTVVALVDNDSGETVSSYVVVIFGDLDGDGTLGPNDMTQMRALTAKMVNYPEGSAQALAADVNHDGMNTSSDYTLIRSASARLSSISQTI